MGEINNIIFSFVLEMFLERLFFENLIAIWPIKHTKLFHLGTSGNLFNIKGKHENNRLPPA